jgi:UDP-glucose 4-epimerase
LYYFEFYVETLNTLGLTVSTVSMGRNDLIVVTGGAGFIGSHLVKQLVNDGRRVRVVDDLSRGSLDNLKDVRGKFEFKQLYLGDPKAALEAVDGASQCFHLAAIVGGVLKMQSHQTLSAVIPAVDYNVINACVKKGVRSFLYTSTACAYPVQLQDEAHEGRKLKEEECYGTVGANPESLYGLAKLYGEWMSTRYHEEFGLKVAIVRDFNVYGPYEDFDVETGHVIPALSNKVLRLVEDGGRGTLEVWGTGKQSRSFVYVDDVASGMILAMDKIEDATPINLGSESIVPIAELAQNISDLAGFRGSMKFRPDMPQGVFTRMPDASRAKNLLGWTATTPLSTGLRKTLDYWKTKSREVVAAAAV